MWLEEWIDYHIQLGFGPFYLYNNSKVEKKSAFDAPKAHFFPQITNKYGIKYSEIIPLSQEQIVDILLKLQDKYKDMIHFIEWSSKDKTGAICHNQVEAHNDCLNRIKQAGIDWCASIDMDEFIVIKSSTIQEYINSIDVSISCVMMHQHLFDTRFNHIGELITQVSISKQELLPWGHSLKYLYKTAATDSVDIHYCKTSGKIIYPSLDVICFNHYKIDLKNPNNPSKIMMNMNRQIVEKIKANSANYIVLNYMRIVVCTGSANAFEIK